MKHAEEPFMSPGGGSMEGFNKIMAGGFGNIEPVFEVQGSVRIFPIFLGGSRDPGFAC